jgi:hypothetical protein
MIVTLIPHRRGAMFAAELPNGMRIKPMKVPIFGTARALSLLGFAPATLLEFKHIGSDIIAARGTVGEPAKWTVSESDRDGLQKRLWKPFENAHPSQAEEPRTDAQASRAPEIGAAQPRPPCRHAPA